MNSKIYPFLTAELGGVSGAIRQRPDDFFVEEIPLYEPSGTGTHIYALIEKTQLSTHDAIARIAAALGVRRMDIGFAGRKDAQAVSRQWISIEHIHPDKLAALDNPLIKVLKLSRHENKLKTGHLKANRFVLKMRELSSSRQQAMATAQAILDVLTKRGTPNYFGPQRFGGRGDSGVLGLALIKNDMAEFCRLFLGDPNSETDPQMIQARRLYEQGQYDQALDCWPRAAHDQRRMLKELARTGGNVKRASRAMDDRMKNLLVSAWQSEIFNATLAARMPHIDRLLLGDMAIKHDNGACFTVEDTAVEQPRCDRLEISPTGPLPGLKMARLSADAGAIENPIIEAAGLTEDDLRRTKNFGAPGARRALRFVPRHVSVDAGKDSGGYFLQLAFELDSGCYATTLLREITKTEIV